jgi:hypothetical protein
VSSSANAGIAESANVTIKEQDAILRIENGGSEPMHSTPYAKGLPLSISSGNGMTSGDRCVFFVL